MPQVNAQLAELLQSNQGIRPSQLGPDVTVFHDLGIAGIDGFMFMEAFAHKFTVDLRDFDCDRYFGPELPFNPFIFLFDLVRGINRIEQTSRLTVAHLESVIERGVWYDPV